MKYLLKTIWVACLAFGAVVTFLVGLAYYCILYPLYHLHWHSQPWAWIADAWRDFKKEVREFWRGEEEPLFYPGWTEGLTMQQAQDKVSKHTVSWFAYCRQQGSFNPK